MLRCEVADCISLPLEDNSVGLVLCSPPYEDARTYGIDFKAAGQAWVDWAVPRFMEHLRVCRGLVAWVVEGRTRQYSYTATPILLMAELARQGVTLRKPPIYRRNGIPGSGGPDWLRNDYEFVICATKGGRLPWSDNTAMGLPPRYGPGGAMSHRLKDGTRKHNPCRRADGKTESQTYRAPSLANPGNVIDCRDEASDIVDCGAVGGGNIGSKLAHDNEAPFPEKLAEFFIRSFCAPNDIVLDPFCGSGTTPAMAIKHGRKAMAFDIRQSQVELTRRRVAEVVQ